MLDDGQITGPCSNNAMSCFLPPFFYSHSRALSLSPPVAQSRPRQALFSYYSLIIPLTGEQPSPRNTLHRVSCLWLEVCLSAPRSGPVVPFASRSRHFAPLTEAIEGIHTIHWTATLLGSAAASFASRISCFGPPPGRWFSPVQLLHTPVHSSPVTFTDSAIRYQSILFEHLLPIRSQSSRHTHAHTHTQH